MMPIIVQRLHDHLTSLACTGRGIWEHNLFFHPNVWGKTKHVLVSLKEVVFQKEVNQWLIWFHTFIVCILFGAAVLISTVWMYTTHLHWVYFLANSRSLEYTQTEDFEKKKKILVLLHGIVTAILDPPLTVVEIVNNSNIGLRFYYSPMYQLS